MAGYYGEAANTDEKERLPSASYAARVLLRPTGLLRPSRRKKGSFMRVRKQDVDVRMDIPGAVIRQTTRFGDFTGYGKVSCEYFTLASGLDTAALFTGLEDNLCQCPHWGYVLRGQLTTTDGSGQTETVAEGDLFYWSEGHNVHVDSDAEVIMFSPEVQHTAVIDHMIDMAKG